MQLRKTLYGLSLTICLVITGVSVLAQSSEQELDLARRRAEAEARKAEAQARAAEAQARAAEANTRRSEIANRKAELELLSAKTTVSGELVETDISAYKAVSCAASEINQKVRTLGGQIDVLMVYSPEFANTMAGYSVLMNQLDLLKKRYHEGFAKIPKKKTDDKSRDGDGPQPIVSASQTILDPVSQIRALSVDMLSLFKTDVQITGKTVVIGKDEFIAKVLNGMNVEVYYPEKIVPISARESSRFLLVINDLAELRMRSKDLLEEEPDLDEEIRSRFKSLNKIYDSVILQFFPRRDAARKRAETEDEGKNISYGSGRRTIVDYVRAELAFDIMAKKDNRRKYWLDVHVTKAGSNRRNKSSAVLDIFTGGKRISFSGGAIVNYRIFGSNGRMLASDTILTYMPFKRSKKIARYECLNVVDTLP